MSKRLLAVLVGSAALVGGCAAAWTVSPSFRERVLVVGLASGVAPVQRASADALAELPTRDAALALLAFVNLLYEPPVDLRHASRTLARPEDGSELDHRSVLATLERFECGPAFADPKLGELSKATRRELLTCLEAAVAAREPERVARAELAERGLRSLCILSGHDFETHFERHGSGVSWGRLSDPRWRRSLGAVNGWALETFGAELLAGMLGGALG